MKIKFYKGNCEVLCENNHEMIIYGVDNIEIEGNFFHLELNIRASQILDILKKTNWEVTEFEKWGEEKEAQIMLAIESASGNDFDDIFDKVCLIYSSDNAKTTPSKREFINSANAILDGFNVSGLVINNIEQAKAVLGHYFVEWETFLINGDNDYSKTIFYII